MAESEKQDRRLELDPVLASEAEVSYSRQSSTALSLRAGVFQQVAATFIVDLLPLAFGLGIGWLPPVQLLLQSEDSPLESPLDDLQVAYMGSLVFLGGIAGTFIWGKLADVWGRQKAALCIAIPTIAGWLIKVTSKNITSLYIARLLMGFSGSGCFIVCPLYVSETANDELRGPLGSCVILFFNVGVLLAYTVGAVVPYWWFSAFCLSVPVAFVIIFYFFPESPDFLWLNNKSDEAENSLMWLRGGNQKVVQQEMLRLSSREQEPGQAAFSSLIHPRANRRAIEIGLVMLTTQQFCGILVILSYTADIFIQSGSSISSSASVILVGVFQLIGSFISPLIVNKTGRKVILLVSILIMGFCLGVLGTYFIVKDYGGDVSSFQLVPVTSLCLHVVSYACGVGPVPYIILGEILEPKIRGLAMSAVILWATIFSYVSVQLYPFLIYISGNAGCYWFFGICCGVAFVYTLFRIPETRGTTIDEMLDRLNNENKTKYDVQESSSKI